MRIVASKSFYMAEETGHLILFGDDSFLTRGDLRADVLYGGEVLAANVSPDRGRRITAAFPLPRLPLGGSEVRCRLSAAGQTLAEVSCVVTRLAPKANAVQIDRISGGLIADGLPFLPYGFYCPSAVPPTLAEGEVVLGFNMISPYQRNLPEDVEQRRRYMEQCAALGMKVHYHVISVSGGGGIGSARIEGEVDKETLLRAEIEAFRDHPALLAWYLSDEPEGQGVSVDTLERSYRIIRELDPYHPITIVFMAPHRAVDYRNAMDIVMTDPYPIPNDPPGVVLGFLRTLEDAFGPAMPMWLVPQCFGGNEYWTREPTPGELRVMTCLGLIEGVTGVQYFIRRELTGNPKSPVLWHECSRIALETAQLTPFFLSHEARPRVASADEAVRAGAWRDRGMVLVMAVNTENQPRATSVLVEGVDYEGPVDVLFENRTVKSAAGPGVRIDDIIDGYGARFYQIPVGPFPREDLAPHPHNLLVDPSFEKSVCPGTADGFYVSVGNARGATCFLDSRVARHGRHSLRLNAIAQGESVTLNPFLPSVRSGKTHRLSVWAKAAPRGEMPRLQLKIGVGEEAVTAPFQLTTDWREYHLDSPFTRRANWGGISVSLESPGTAWIDLMQFFDITPTVAVRVDAVTREPVVTIEPCFPDAEIHYTLDGSEPCASSALYTAPFPLSRSATIRMVEMRDRQVLSLSEAVVHRHEANGCVPELKIPFSHKYHGGGPATLTGGFCPCDPDYRGAQWHGLEGDDIEATIDLGRAAPLREVRARFLQATLSWIFLPLRVRVLGSADGRAFREIAEAENPIPATEVGPVIREFSLAGGGEAARYVRVHAQSRGVCPGGHMGAGGKAWTFIEEIQVNPME